MSGTEPAPSPPRRLRVVLVEDHRLFRQGLRGLLEDHGHAVVGEAATAREGLRVVREKRPDVVVLDLNLPGASGLEVIAEMRDRAPGSAIVIMTMSAAQDDVVDALRAGAAGYVLKDSPVDEMLASLDAAVAGAAPISPSAAARLVDHLRASGPSAAASPAQVPAVQLSSRQLEVLRRLVEGRDNREIADDLHVAVGTVKSDVAQILAKLGVGNRVEAAATAVRLGIV